MRSTTMYMLNIKLLLEGSGTKLRKKKTKKRYGACFLCCGAKYICFYIWYSISHIGKMAFFVYIYTHIQWINRVYLKNQDIRLESLHRIVIFLQSLAKQEHMKAYFLAKKGLKSIADVPHHRVNWNHVTELVLSLVHVPPLDGDRSRWRS